MPTREPRTPASSSTTRIDSCFIGVLAPASASSSTSPGVNPGSAAEESLRCGKRSSDSCGQLDDEPSAVRTDLLHPDDAVVLLNDAADDGQPETAAALLGREVRHEELVGGVRRDAGAVVGHAQPDAALRTVELRGDGDAATFVRGVDRV